ncbi:unnamed protein product [Clavelina lepadiformis]|uniref:Uncharacterized protein n=1 Tax=Clavelina lepadiformis TaxID=159417 RepID=A0ABP0FBU7_CLALP
MEVTNSMSLGEPHRHDKIQDDWNNREYIELIVGSMRKISSFLNEFDSSCRYRLARLNEKLESLERKLEYIEARLKLLFIIWTKKLDYYHGNRPQHQGTGKTDKRTSPGRGQNEQNESVRVMPRSG